MHFFYCCEKEKYPQLTIMGQVMCFSFFFYKNQNLSKILKNLIKERYKVLIAV